jgi:cytochrome b
VFCVISAWASFRFADAIGDPMLVWHRWNGYTILVLVIFRLFWGFVGSSTSRFTAFVTWPWDALRYALSSANGTARPYLGHNPLGTWMILALLAALVVQGGLGLFALEHNGLTAGPLKRLISDATAEKITKLHTQGINVIISLVIVHISANVLYGLIKKEPLIRAMVTGRKPAEAYADQQEAEIARSVTLRAMICLIAAAGIVFGGVTAFGGRIF